MNQVRSKLNSGGWVDSSSWFSRCFQSLSQNVVRDLSRQMVLPFGWESVTCADETCGREGALFLVMGSRAWHMFKSSHRRQIGGSWSHERHENHAVACSIFPGSRVEMVQPRRWGDLVWPPKQSCWELLVGGFRHISIHTWEGDPQWSIFFNMVGTLCDHPKKQTRLSCLSVLVNGERFLANLSTAKVDWIVWILLGIDSLDTFFGFSMPFWDDPNWRVYQGWLKPPFKNCDFSWIVFLISHYFFVVSFCSAFRNGESLFIDDVRKNTLWFFLCHVWKPQDRVSPFLVGRTSHVVFATAFLDFQKPSEPEVAKLQPLGFMVFDGTSRRCW